MKSFPAFCLCSLYALLSLNVTIAADEPLIKVVVNRDVEGAGVGSSSYQPTATACRDACVDTEGCNIWVWCADCEGTCANNHGSYNAECEVDKSACTNNYYGSDPRASCYSPQSCSGFLDLDVAGTVLDPRGDYNFLGSADECCSMCAKTQFCNVWTYCSDPSGCPAGDYERYRQCWLKSMDFAAGADLEGEFKAAGKSAPGWMSGFRASYIKTK
eukprot:gene1242-32590_t